MVMEGLTARKIITRKALKHHPPERGGGGIHQCRSAYAGLAYEADVDLTVDHFEELSRTTP